MSKQEGDSDRSESGARRPGRSEGMRMEARRAKTCRRHGLVNDSRPCKGMPPLPQR